MRTRFRRHDTIALIKVKATSLSQMPHSEHAGACMAAYRSMPGESSRRETRRRFTSK